ncbi:hypothetical protein Pcinc_042949 [Petrolisthes cinctipes]|uniref:Uncharacterized protein n=1 Tax=Petrolisthes cinctipes TaxID=88211 RepID=A0AAE1BHD9_PETCI|nr:hypothetical protein Pcinc_042949 [Petrolisthes cinctipes]
MVWNRLCVWNEAICEANRVLMSQASNFTAPEGAVAGLAGSLLSQVVAKAFTEGGRSYKRAVWAGEAGRNGGSRGGSVGVECKVLFPGCEILQPRYTPRPGVI